MTKTRVLVVGDSPRELGRTGALLRCAGYDVVAALDGDEALRMAVSTQPAVIVLDVVLPKKNGFQVCREVKSDPATQVAKVILVGATRRESDRHWGLRQGADEFLVKPWQDQELLTALARLENSSPAAGSAA